MRATALLSVLLVCAIGVTWGNQFAVALAAWTETPLGQVETARASEPLSLIALGAGLAAAVMFLKRYPRSSR
jgi:hypothetical protein